MNDTVDNTQQHKQMTVRLSHAQYEALQAMAVNTGATVTECVRQCVDESLSIISPEKPLTAVEKSAHLASIEAMGLLRAWVRKEDPQLVSAVQDGAKEKFLLLIESS